MTEGPYRLPEGWRWVKLGEVVRTESGNSKLIKGRLSPKHIPGLFPAYSASGQDVWHSPPEHSGTAIILSAVGARCGKCFLAQGQWSAIANTHIIWPLEEVVDAKFLWYLINDENFWVKGQSAQPFVKVKATLEKEIPLPPLPEQRRIVARIEELMGRIREAKRLREEAKQDAERLWQSVLAETFPRPGDELPKGWRWVRLGEIAKIFSGTWGNEVTESHNPETIHAKVIRVSDIKESLTIDYDQAPLRAVKKREAERYRLKEGDLVVVKSSGSQAKVISGRAALFTINTGLYIPSNFTFAVRPNQEVISPVFLWYWLNSGYVRALIAKKVSTFTYPNLKKADYENVPIPLPPLPEQRRIVAHLEAVQARIQALKEAQAATDAELQRLEQAILEKAFRGEL